MAMAEDCKLNGVEVHGGEENSEPLLRRNSCAIRQNRTLISDAFSFLTDAEADTDAEEVYSNVCVSSYQETPAKGNDRLCLEDDHVYSNDYSGRNSEISADVVYENMASDVFKAVATNKNLEAAQDYFRGNDKGGSIDGCKSKDSGFASLERGHISDLDIGERMGIQQQGAVIQSVTDDEDEEDDGEEDSEQHQVYYNQQDTENCTEYQNDSMVPAAVPGSNVLTRNVSENVYDDLNLSVTSCHSGNFIVQPPCFDGGDENAIASSAENFSKEVGDNSIWPGEDKSTDIGSTHSGETDLNQSETSKKGTKDPIPDKLDPSGDEGTYDTVICIDLSKTPLPTSDKLIGTLASVLPRTESDSYDEITEYLAPAVQLGAGAGNLQGLDRMDSVDDDDDDGDDQTEGSSNNQAEINQGYEYDTISFLGSDRSASTNGVENRNDSALGANNKGPANTESSETAVLSTKQTLSEANSKNTEKTIGGSPKDLATPSPPNSTEMAKSGDIDAVDAALRRRPKLSRNLSAEIGSDDSSDEETGIYAESFRRSNWIRISGEGKLELSVPPKSVVGQGSPSSSEASSARSSSSSMLSNSISGNTGGLSVNIIRSENLEDIKEDVLSSSPRDDVFNDPLSESVRRQRMHKRSDSTTTTASEKEFKHQYVSRRKCLIQRADSQQEYHRLSARVYDQDKQVLVQRASNDDDLGLHLLDSHPAFITSVDPGSPADLAGILEGQILVSVNDLNVLTTDHADIVKLIQASEGSVRLGVANSDFQPVRDLQAAVMSGFMYKLGNSSFVRTWKKRYFILRQDNCLYYYKSDQLQDNNDPLGAVPLGGYTILRHTETSKDFCFKAEKYGARTYFFMTDNRDQLTEWVGALTEAAARSKKRKESFLSVSSHNVGLPALDIRRPECSGNLNKLSPSNRSWGKRYCVLKDACMYYYKDFNSLRALGVAHLHGYKVDSENHPRKKHSFSLVPPESKMRSFHFAADNETDKKRWVESLIHSIQRWVRVEREVDC